MIPYEGHQLSIGNIIISSCTLKCGSPHRSFESLLSEGIPHRLRHLSLKTMKTKKSWPSSRISSLLKQILIAISVCSDKAANGAKEIHCVVAKLSLMVFFLRGSIYIKNKNTILTSFKMITLDSRHSMHLKYWDRNDSLPSWF